MTTEQFGRYEIRSKLGKGGMATVYLAYDPRFDREVALKVLPEVFLHDDNFRQRFEREARIIARLEHKAIVPVYDFGEHRSQPYLVMRHMAGDSLATRLEEQHQLTSNEILKIVQRIASALDEAHRHGIIHRDLKPGNILFDQYGDAYLADFGIAKLGEATASLTGNTIVGTPAYMSPEQVHGRKTIDGRSDIYTLGIILYELLTGQVPYHAETPVQQMMAHVLEPVPDLQTISEWNLPEDCSAIIKKAMAKEPDERHSTAGELAKDLSEVLQIELGAIDEVDRAPVPPTPRPMQSPVGGGTQYVRPGAEGSSGLDFSGYDNPPATERHSPSLSYTSNHPGNGPTNAKGALDTVISPPAETIEKEPNRSGKTALPRWASGSIIGLVVLLVGAISLFIYFEYQTRDSPAVAQYEAGFRSQLPNELYDLFPIEDDALVLETDLTDMTYPFVEYETSSNPSDILQEHYQIAFDEGFGESAELYPYNPEEGVGSLFIGELSNNRAFDITIHGTEKLDIYIVTLQVFDKIDQLRFSSYETGFLDLIEDERLLEVFLTAAPADSELVSQDLSRSAFPAVEYSTTLSPEEVIDFLEEQLIIVNLFSPEPPRNLSNQTELIFLGIDPQRSLLVSVSQRDGAETLVHLEVVPHPPPPRRNGAEEDINFEAFESQFLQAIDPSLHPLFIFPFGAKVDHTNTSDPMFPLLEVEIYRSMAELIVEYQGQLENQLGLTYVESRSLQDSVEALYFVLADGRTFTVEFKEDIEDGETKIKMFIEPS